MYIRPWAAMKKARRDAAREPCRDAENAAVKSSPDCAIRVDEDNSSSSSPVAQLKEKLLGKMDFRVEFRRAFSIVSEKGQEREEDLNFARAGVAMIKDVLKGELDLKKVIVLGDTGVSLSHPGTSVSTFLG
jgi:hypothetical protein